MRRLPEPDRLAAARALPAVLLLALVVQAYPRGALTRSGGAMSILGDAWPHEASRRVKAAIAARFGKGWSVRHDPRLVRLDVSGPKGSEGYRTIPAEHNGALSAALGLSYACPLDGPSVGPLEWEHFVWALENGRLQDAHVQTWAAWGRIEQARRYRAANPWLVFVWQTYVHGSARNDLPGEWEKHSRCESEAAAQAAAQRLQALGIATRIEREQQ